jgi:UDP-glucose 4-epimerase
MATDDRPQVVLVTGVSRFLGAQIAANLAARPDVHQVIGLDPYPPATDVDLSGVEVVQADLRSAEEIIGDLGVRAVAHLAVISSPGRGVAARR